MNHSHVCMTKYYFGLELRSLQSCLTTPQRLHLLNTRVTMTTEKSGFSSTARQLRKPATDGSALM